MSRSLTGDLPDSPYVLALTCHAPSVASMFALSFVACLVLNHILPSYKGCNEQTPLGFGMTLIE